MGYAKSFTIVLFLMLLAGAIFAVSADRSDNGGSRAVLENKSQGERSILIPVENEDVIEQDKMYEEEVVGQVRAREKEQNRVRDGEQDGTQGISSQVHQIIAERKNGTITVSQGMAVRVVAKNHSMSVEDVLLEVNDTISINIKHKGKDKVIKIKAGRSELIISDEELEAYTPENISIENGSLYVSGKKVLVLPSEVQEKTNVKAIKSAKLHMRNGNPEYVVNATKSARFLWLFDIDMDVEVTLDATTSQVKEEKRPWWSFLASTNYLPYASIDFA